MKQRGERLRKVVSVCEQRDIAVWQLVCRRLPQCITADIYQLICPDAQADRFRAVTLDPWVVVVESHYSAGCRVEDIRARVTGCNEGRVNWLFQQFLKIQAIVDPEMAADDVVLIWDADTLPLRKLDFGEQGSALSYYHGREHHAPYFDTFRKLFGCGRQADVSFIAQCMPVRAGRVREMVAEVEAAGTPFAEAVMEALPGKSGSEFSEYETIGNWLLLRHPEEVELRRANRWLRSGALLFGGHMMGWRARLLPGLLAWRYDFVAIEKWRRPLDWPRFTHFLRRRAGWEI